MRDEQLLKAIETIYDAALEPERWHDTIRAVADFVGAERGMVGLTDTRSGHADISYRYRMDPELMDRKRLANPVAV